MSLNLFRLGASAFLASLLAIPLQAQVPEVPPFNRDAPLGDVPEVPTEPEPLTRGPVHEGFAQPDLPPVPGTAVPKQPPPPIDEVPPDQKPEGANVVWLPGYWMWDASRSDFVWVTGTWRNSPPGKKYVPGYWTKAETGWIYVSGLWVPSTADEIPYFDQPPASLERGPAGPPPNDDSIYVPGVWKRNGGRFVWRPGFWLDGKPGWIYTPPRWIWTPRGYLFVDGFWDFPIENRGLLFAPAYIPPTMYSQPGFVYRPSLVIGFTPLLGSLWLQPGFGSYAFGNYYGPGHLRRGYQPWATYGARRYDPLYGYYRFTNRSNPGWGRNLVSTYNGRVAGHIARPASTYAHQRAGRRGAVVVSPLSSSRVRLTRVTRADHAARARATTGYRSAATARRTLEARHGTRATSALPLGPGPRTGGARLGETLRPRPTPAPRYTPPSFRSTPSTSRTGTPSYRLAPPTARTAPPVHRPSPSYRLTPSAPRYSSPAHRMTPSAPRYSAPTHRAMPSHRAAPSASRHFSMPSHGGGHRGGGGGHRGGHHR